LTIVLDAMGGDNAPSEIVLGAIDAAPLVKSRITLVGKVAAIEKLLPSPCPPNIDIVPASEVVEMNEKPTAAYRTKKDSSLMVATRLIKEGRGQALISAGNTGAVATFAYLNWGQMKGIHKPAIAAKMPSKHDGFFLVDAGASPDADPAHLVEFAIMGRAYAERVMGRRNPRVHLLNIGEEEGKGNAVTKRAYELLKRNKWFAGNIEGKDIFFQHCDVVICDAFVGNIVLKAGEGIAELIVDELKEAVPKNPILQLPYAPLRSIMGPLRKRMDYAEYGGSPLLGLNGICVICHGRSSAKAIKNAVLLAQKMIDSNIGAAIQDALKGRTPPEVELANLDLAVDPLV